MKAFLVLISVMMFNLSSVSFAQTPETKSEKKEDVVEKREARQQKRIEEGVKNGSLTPEETKKLEAQQANLKTAEQKAMADGKMTKKEFKQIEKKQNRASNNIRNKKHNKNN